MKQKLLFSIAFFVALSFAAKAQLTTGKILVGGNVGITSVTNNDDAGNKTKSSSYNVSPSFGLVYRNNRVAGISLSYSHLNSALDGNGFGTSFFLRQYKPFGRIFYVFGQESLYYNYLKTKQVIMFEPGYLSRTDKVNNLGLSLAPGFACDVTPHLQLELLLNSLVNLSYSNTRHVYSNTAYYKNSTDKQFALGSNFDLSQLSSINVGVRLLIGR